ncbi:MAG: class I SAM-dependent methyltransferase [Colwellia sp.]|nr:class I SAM-dependent methyltransferase [Colwellia sp.]
MKTIKTLLSASIISLSLASVSAAAHTMHSADNAQLAQAVASEHRSAANKLRDQYRHPQQTLEFFGFKSNMTVVEITPGGGWYTEILAPALKGKGKLIAAHYPDTGEDNYYSNSRKRLEKKLAGHDMYSEVELSNFVPKKASELAPAGTADMVLTFRNLHNWGEEGVQQVFIDAFKALKANGVLGVVEHRLPKGAMASDENRGYVSVEKTIAQAKAAGFTLIASSEVNANVKDKANYEKGVWTLPPSFALKDKNKEKYSSIGESDRMTLKFAKVAK